MATRLSNPHRNTLTKEDLQKFHVWVWDDENLGLLPISDSKFTTDYGVPFIKASFHSKHHSFDGVLIGFNPFNAFEIFINNTIVGFNVNLTSFLHTNLKEVFTLLDCEPYSFFPLEYSSPVNMPDGTRIAGQFVLRNEKLVGVTF